MTGLEPRNKSMAKEFARYAIPSIVGMVVSSLYSIVDGIFVGRGVGEHALAAVNIAYPLIMLHIALAMFVAIGGANSFSINKGRGKSVAANNIFTQSMGMVAGISILLNAFILLFPDQVSLLLGADAELLPYVSEYIWWVALFAIPYMPGLALSIFIRNDNAPRRELIGTLLGAVTNMVLDYLFIMEFNMGIAGAAIATGIGQVVSVLFFMTHFLQKKRLLQIRRPSWNLPDVKKILLNGASSFLMEFSQSAIAFSFNLVLMARIGSIGVSAYGIVMYICSIFNMVLIGLVQGAQPIMSYNHGLESTANVNKIYRLSIGSSLCLTVLMYTTILLIGKELAAIFIPGNLEVAEMAAGMMNYYFLAFFPLGISLINILFFQVTEKESRSILISFLRCIGFVQLALLILPNLFGTMGIYLSFLCGELCNCILSVVLKRGASMKEQRSLPNLKPGENVQ